MAAGDQREIDRGGLTHGNNRGLRLSEAESLGMHFNPVGSRVHLREEEASLRVALDRADGTGVYFGCLDLGIGNRCAAVVEQRPRERAAGSALRPKQRC